MLPWTKSGASSFQILLPMSRSLAITVSSSRSLRTQLSEATIVYADAFFITFDVVANPSQYGLPHRWSSFDLMKTAAWM
jgi:hypothetical protein